jgi:hypothetical protein
MTQAIDFTETYQYLFSPQNADSLMHQSYLMSVFTFIEGLSVESELRLDAPSPSGENVVQYVYEFSIDWAAVKQGRGTELGLFEQSFYVINEKGENRPIFYIDPLHQVVGDPKIQEALNSGVFVKGFFDIYAFEQHHPEIAQFLGKLRQSTESFSSVTYVKQG